jgi:hypothetical protein
MDIAFAEPWPIAGEPSPARAVATFASPSPWPSPTKPMAFSVPKPVAFAER